MFVKNRFLLVLCLPFLFSGSLYAIDCNKAAKPDEKIICNNETLRNYDAAMSKIYTLILNSLNDVDKKKFIEDQKSWLKERGNQEDETKLSDFYLQKVRSQCKAHEAVCKSFTDEILKKWQTDPKNLTNEDSIIIASYFQANLSRYITDQKALKEVEDDISFNDNLALLQNVDLHKLDNNNILLTIPLFMAAYQGPSISFLYDGKDFQVVRFPIFDEKLTYPFTHSNYADWDKNTLMIHNRSLGLLYECGGTQYLEFEKNTFKLIKQTYMPCSEKELEAIQSGKLSPENIKSIVVYPK